MFTAACYKSESLLLADCHVTSFLLMTYFITAVAGVPINNFSGHLRYPVLCVFAKNIGSRNYSSMKADCHTAVAARNGGRRGTADMERPTWNGRHGTADGCIFPVLFSSFTEGV